MFLAAIPLKKTQKTPLTKKAQVMYKKHKRKLKNNKYPNILMIIQVNLFYMSKI